MRVAEEVAPQRAARALFGLAGRVLAIENDDGAVSSVLREAYAPAAWPNPQVADSTASFKRLGDGRLSVRLDRRALPMGDGAHRSELLSAHYAVKEVFARFACAQAGAVAFYGSLVAIDGGGLLILGPTTIGKTVLALHLALQGANFLGDETAVLDVRSASIAALARKPSLRESALPFFPENVRAGMERTEQIIHTERGRFWYAMDVEGVEPSTRSFPLRAVCILRERAPAFSLRRSNFGDALDALAARTYVRPSRLAELSALRRAMRRTAFFDISLAAPDLTAAALLREVRACE